ncbi:MAG TPA: DUF1360 domain-containing protein [Baekduia sp.]|uniref:DUF1360 domain-containing protein n=1 Tax=Baekduia sp. TaxID=2600305 RepID=UPI002C5A3DE0|nr:DUF1360 domain-containing protein [Baekduia sp.]HMJ35663.1 DUF1360 domain-containing protein [Baekduia sp.]
MDPVSTTPTKPIDYATLSAGYGTLLGALVVASRAKEAEPVRPGELPVLGLATFALAKLVAKEKVDSWVREPFVEERVGRDGIERRPKGRRLRYAVGELLSCTRCVGSWSALGLVGLRLLRPREAQVVLPVLALAAANDWLQSGFTTLCAGADLAQQQAQAQALPPDEDDDEEGGTIARFQRPPRPNGTSRDD